MNFSLSAVIVNEVTDHVEVSTARSLDELVQGRLAYLVLKIELCRDGSSKARC